MDSKDLSFTSHRLTSVTLGNKIFPGSVVVRGKTFVFTPRQEAFLLELQKLKSVHAAALNVGWSEDHAEKFLNSAKFSKFRNLKLEEAKVKAGINTEMLFQYAQWNLEGKKTWWDVECKKCSYKDEWVEYQVESFRNDDLTLTPICPTCFEVVVLEKKESSFSMNREQMDMWKEIASRFIPKIERIHHEFSKEEIVFETEGKPS